MKKTLSILAVAVLSMSAATSYAKEVILYPTKDYIELPVVSQVIASGATLINSETGKVVVYDLNDASVTNDTPFDITKGMILWDFKLNNSYNEPITLSDVSQDATDRALRVSTGDVLVLDFTSGAITLGGPTDAEYMVLMFHPQTTFGNDFAEWYSTNGVAITARFTSGDYTAYVIDNTCDLPGSGPSSTYGGLVVFNKSVAETVSLAEVDPDTITPAPEPSPFIPEPTTSTLSLLALAGLAARRRRK